MNAQTETNKDQLLNAKELSFVKIAALTAKGDLENLRQALNAGLDSGLTVNEIKEVLVQMYAYAGFPRSLNGINTFMKVIEDRKNKGIEDTEGKTAAATPETGDKYERGRKTLETLTKQPQTKPAKGFGEFAPAIDRFLKEHLFADIFDRDILTFRQRELATISALTAMTGVESQLESHFKMGLNVGLTESQLNDLMSVIKDSIGRNEADSGRKILNKVTKNGRQTENTENTTMENNDENAIFPRGDKAPAENFTGAVRVKMLAQKNENNNFSIASVTFEPNARSNWHTHPAGQTLIVIEGTGLYQEKGQPIKTIRKGETIICNSDIEHWHGASP